MKPDFLMLLRPLVTICGSTLIFLLTSGLSACSGASTQPARAEPSEEALRIPSGGVELAATLCLPAGQPPFPAFVALHGSGLTWGKDLQFYCNALTPRGVAVLLYDKRGVGNSGGEYRSVSVENSVTQLDELANDAVAAVDFLRQRADIDPKRIGLIGQSQAGWIIPLAASKRPDLRFVVIISGPSVSTGEEMYYSALTGDRTPDAKAMRDTEYEKKRKADFRGPYGYDPEPVLSELRVPSLWIFGGKDESIPAYRCLRILSDARAKNDLPMSLKVYADGNHGLHHFSSGQQMPYWDFIYEWLAERRLWR